MANCASLDIEFFETEDEAYLKEGDEIHKWHPEGQNCTMCSSEPLTASGLNFNILSTHLETAKKFVDAMGSIPTDTWLIKYGFADFCTYARVHSKLFREFPKIRRKQGRPRKHDN